jgi:hypothetical protein
MFTPIHVLTVLFLVLAVASLAAAVLAFRRRSLFGATGGTLVALLALALAALSAVISIGIRGYRALTHEELAATVRVVPTAPHAFTARFRFPDGDTASFHLAGDQIYVDARILKWKALANLIGLQTAYELDRVAGRYRSIEDERTMRRTVYSLARDRPIDLFSLRRRLPFLAPIVDARYGSGTFVPADRPATWEIRVSTTGLLARSAGSG